MIEELKESGEPIPEPLSSHHYSGRFNVRIGTDLHRALAFEAARQGVSLNQLVARKLASETRINPPLTPAAAEHSRILPPLTQPPLHQRHPQTPLPGLRGNQQTAPERADDRVVVRRRPAIRVRNVARYRRTTVMGVCSAIGHHRQLDPCLGDCRRAGVDHENGGAKRLGSGLGAAHQDHVDRLS